MTRLFHRTAVSLFLLLWLAALVGLFGKGPLSETQALSPDNTFAVHYDRFLHYQSPAQLRIAVAASQTTSGLVGIRVSRRFVGNVEIQNFAPAPSSEVAGPEFFTYLFPVETNRPVQITLRFSPEHYGRLNYRIGLTDGPELRLQHISFP